AHVQPCRRMNPQRRFDALAARRTGIDQAVDALRESGGDLQVVPVEQEGRSIERDRAIEELRLYPRLVTRDGFRIDRRREARERDVRPAGTVAAGNARIDHRVRTEVDLGTDAVSYIVLFRGAGAVRIEAEQRDAGYLGERLLVPSPAQAAGDMEQIAEL